MNGGLNPLISKRPVPNSGEIGERGLRRWFSGVDCEDPEAGDEKYVFAGETSGTACPSDSTGSTSIFVPSPAWIEGSSGAIVSTARGWCFLEGGRGRNLDLRDEASRSVRVGNSFLSGVSRTCKPSGGSRPVSTLRVAAGRSGVADLDNGGVCIGGGDEGGSGALDSSRCAPCGVSVRGFLATVTKTSSSGGVSGRVRFGGLFAA